MDTDSLYFALSEKELYDCIREESKMEWGLMRTEACKDDFRSNATTNFFPRNCCTEYRKHDKREPGLLKEEFRFTEMLCFYAVKPTVVMTLFPTKKNSAANV